MRNIYRSLIFLWALFLCRMALFSDRVLMPPGGDHVNSIYGTMIFFHEWAKRGVFPLWNPLILCGQPFGIHSITGYNFYYLFSALFEAGTAFNFLVLMSLFLGALCLFLLLRNNGLSGFAACVSTLGWMFMFSREVDSGFFFMPLCFYLADLTARKNDRRLFAALVVSLALYSLNANIQYFLYGGFFIFCYLFSLRGRPGRPGPSLRRIFLGFVLAAGLGLFYHLRLVQLASTSTRSAWTEMSMLFPTHLLQAVFPRLFESPTRPELDFLVPRILQGLGTSFFPELRTFLSVPYAGIFSVTAFLICLFWLQKNRDAFTRFFLFSVLSVLGYLVFQPLVYQGVARHVPVLSGMTGVVRAFNVYHFALAVLSAKAIDLLLTGSRDVKQIYRRVARVFLGLALALFLGMAALRAALISFNAQILKKISANLNATADPSIFIENTSDFARQRAGDFFYFFRELSSFKNPHVLVPMGLALIFFTACFLYFSRRAGDRAFKIFLVVFILMDTGSVWGFSVPASTRSELAPGAAVAEAIKNDTGLYRVFAIEDKTRSIHRMFLRPQRNMIYGLATPDGYGEMYQKRYVKFYEWLTQRERRPGALHFMDDFNKPLADFLNCKYIVTNAANSKLEDDSGFQKIFDNRDYKVFKNKDAMPRAFVVHEALFFNRQEEMAAYIRQQPEQLKKQALLEGDPRPVLRWPVAGRGEDPVWFRVYEPNRRQIEFESSGEGYLVMSESFSKDWAARLDGRNVSLERADYAFTALKIGEGKQALSLAYQPRSLRWGMALSLVTFIFFVIVLVFLL